MPDLGANHPQIVHFVVALLVVGVGFRVLSFLRATAFLGSAATILILAGTLASVAAVRSGGDAHEPAEHIPGAREAVHEHGEWGVRTRNAFGFVSLFEILGVVLRRRGSARHRLAFATSAVLGVPSCFALYEAAEHGGEVVYEYAGGVGTRTGDPADVGRLLVAGLFQQAMIDRNDGRHEEAADLIDVAARRFPDDPEIGLLQAESLLLDRKDPAAALERARGLSAATDNVRLRVRLGLVEVDALQSAGRVDEAKTRLEALATAHPESGMIKRRLGQPRE